MGLATNKINDANSADGVPANLAILSRALLLPSAIKIYRVKGGEESGAAGRRYNSSYYDKSDGAS